MSTSQVDTGEDIGAIDTIRRGMAFSPELTEGIRVTLLLAVLASVGQIIVPIAVQQTLDHGLNADGGPNVGFARGGSTGAIQRAFSMPTAAIN